MSVCRYLLGDTRDVVESLPDGSIDLVLTSPPFLALRSYLPSDHPDKWREIGSEPTPADFLDTLLDLTELWRRKLAPHGSIAIELGDTYSGSTAGGGDYQIRNVPEGQRATRRESFIESGVEPNLMPRRGNGWPMAKSLCGIPHLYHLSLAYGRNMLRPERTISPWRVRNVIAWTRPNPPVGALGDKFRPATSYMTIATVAGDRYFDLDAVRHEPADHSPQRRGKVDNLASANRSATRADAGKDYYNIGNPAGAPPNDWWTWDWEDGAGWVLDTPDGLRWYDAFDPELWKVSTEPYAGAHFATWSRKLLTRPIEAMVPHRVCTACGKPSRRIVGEATYTAARQAFTDDARPGKGYPDADDRRGMSGTKAPAYKTQDTLGWSDCECPGGEDRWRRGVVLDPFGGSGSTAAVATGLGRDCVLVDLDERNVDLARERVGMFLEVEDMRPAAVANVPITADVPDVSEVSELDGRPLLDVPVSAQTLGGAHAGA